MRASILTDLELGAQLIFTFLVVIPETNAYFMITLMTSFLLNFIHMLHPVLSVDASILKIIVMCKCSNSTLLGTIYCYGKKESS